MIKIINSIIVIFLFLLYSGCSTFNVQVVTDRSRLHIPAWFEDASDFSEGLARVKKSGRYCFIDKNGNVVVKSRYKIESDFREGMAIVSDTGSSDQKRYGYINKEGLCMIEPRFIEAYGFHEGLARVRVRDNKIKNRQVVTDYKGRKKTELEPVDKWCYIDLKGNVVFETVFSEAGDFHDGLALAGKKYNIEKNMLASIDDRFGYIDKQGNIAINPVFYSARDFHEGLAAVSTDKSYNRRSGYINKKGVFVIDQFYNKAGDFQEGLSLVQKEYECIYIDKKGSPVIEIEDNNTGCDESSFHDGLAVRFRPGSSGGHGYDFYEGVVETGEPGKAGYIDKKNNMVIEQNFVIGSDFSEGFARVMSINGKCGYINRSGKMVIELNFPESQNSSGDIKSIIYKQGKVFYSDQKGKLYNILLYDSTGDFHEGLARLKLNGRWGYIKYGE